MKNPQEKYNELRIRIKTLSNDIFRRRVGDHNLIDSEIEVLKSSARRSRAEAKELKKELKTGVTSKPLMYLWRFENAYRDLRKQILNENKDLDGFENNLDNLIRVYSRTLNRASKITSTIHGLNYSISYFVKDKQLLIIVKRNDKGSFKTQTYFVC
jgi:hypothetical protein